jgi:2'-5' RNA ligase
MLQLHRSLVDELEKRGIVPEDRPFRPHITVGRTVRGEPLPPSMKELLLSPPGWAGPIEHADALAVMSSSLDRREAEYSILTSVPLEGDADPERKESVCDD